MKIDWNKVWKNFWAWKLRPIADGDKAPSDFDEYIKIQSIVEDQLRRKHAKRTRR